MGDRRASLPPPAQPLTISVMALCLCVHVCPCVPVCTHMCVGICDAAEDADVDPGKDGV